MKVNGHVKKHFVLFKRIGLVVILLITVTNFCIVSAEEPAHEQNVDWTSPIGIPNPKNVEFFGGFDPIQGSYMMYQDKMYDFGNGPEAYKDTGNGPYTHYVDYNNTNATDLNNPFGTVEKPRKTIPNEELLPGSVVEIHSLEYNRDYTVKGNGTQEAPIFIRGVNNPQMRALQFSQANQQSYMVAENLTVGKITINAPSHHIVIRNCELPFEEGGISVGNYIEGEKVHHIIIYNNRIHNADDTWDESTGEDTDWSGFIVNCNYGNQGSEAHHIWVLDNEIFHCKGGGINGGQSGNIDDEIHHIFIGRNHLYENRQSSIGIKVCSDVIISQNTIHDHKTSLIQSSNYGAGVALQYGTQNAWVIYNEIYNSEVGIKVPSSKDMSIDYTQYYIGNVIHDIYEKTPVDNWNWKYAPAAFMIWGGDNVYIVDNTVFNVNAGIYSPAQRGADGKLNNTIRLVKGNIFSDVRDGHFFAENCSLGEEGSVEFVDNIVYQSEGKEVTFNISNQVLSFNQIKESYPTGIMENFIFDNPGFIDTGSGNFRISSTSPARDSGSATNVYQVFYETYALDICKDFDSSKRPQGTAWDIGAFELPPGGESIPETPNPTFTLNIQATNGTVVKDPDKASYEQGETVRLISRPAPGYMFDSWGGDASGTRLIADVTMDGDKTIIANYKSWETPLGIPEPSFGIRETYRMYDNESKRNLSLTYHQNEEGGFYTHYVDNSHPSATDSNNPYGTADKPRMTFPKDSDVLPGSVIELHGQIYTINQKILHYCGTAAQPIFFRGYSADQRVEIARGELILNAQYLICENIKKTGNAEEIPNGREGGSLNVRSFNGAQAHHVAIRYCETMQTGAMMAVAYAGNFTSVQTILPADNIVFYSNHLNMAHFVPGGQISSTDTCAISLQENSSNIWCIDNLIQNARADAIGGGHDDKYTCRNVYAGRNVMHTCGENAIDVKEVDTFIATENVMYDFRGWKEGIGGAVVFHYGPKYSPRNVWFMNNEIFDCDLGIQVGGSQEYPVHIIGNIVHDIHQLSDPGNGYAFTTWNCRQVYLQGNLFFDVDNGVDWRVNNAGGKLFLEDNIVTGVREGGSHLNISSGTQADAAVLSGNTFYEENRGIQIKRGGQTYQTAEAWNDMRGKAEVSNQNLGISDPLLYKYEPESAIVIYFYGDMNNDGVVDIVDLAYTARNIDMTSVSDNWNAVIKADMNSDDKIDIVDLSSVARLIK